MSSAETNGTTTTESGQTSAPPPVSNTTGTAPIRTYVITRGVQRLRLSQESSDNEHEQRDKWEKIQSFAELGEARPTPQCLQLSDDQVQNNAGGFVYTVSDKIRVRRFLILGTMGGTYYAKEQELKLENLKDLVDMIEKGKALDVLNEINDVNSSNRAPKMSPLIYCLALIAKTPGPVETKEQKEARRHILHQAYQLFPKVCRIPTHLFQFVAYCEQISKGKSTGWGRAHRVSISNWYLKKNVISLAQAVTKYQRRKDWSHRDVLRLAHPNVKRKPANLAPQQPFDVKTEHSDVFLYCTQGFDALLGRHASFLKEQQNPPPVVEPTVSVSDEKEKKPKKAPRKRLVDDAPNYLLYLQAVEDLKICQDENEAVRLIKNFGLVREHTPTSLLNSVAVWKALLESMPMTAMIRNLNKMTSIGLITAQDNDESKAICRKLLDVEALKSARIHPFNVLLALAVYKAGKGDKGKLKWKPNEPIVNALDEAFYKSFANVQPTGKRFLLALDVSGSMSCHMAGSPLSCREASAAMAMLTLRTEPHCEMVSFQDQLIPLDLRKEDKLNDVVTKTSNLPFGTTDCSLPMLWAAQQQKRFDCFIVYTDNETWSGDVHPTEAMKMYRQKSGVADAKLIVVGMTATKFTIADPKDPNMMDIVGFDSAAPELIRNFVASGFETIPADANTDFSFLDE